MLYNIIIILEEGCYRNTPALFDSEDKAGVFFEKAVVKKGFRARNQNESWSDYATAYYDWVDTEDCPFDPMDFEIHWDEEIAVNPSIELIEAIVENL